MTLPETNITVIITPNSTNLTDCIPLEKPQECPEDVWFQIVSKENELGLEYCQSGKCLYILYILIPIFYYFNL